MKIKKNPRKITLIVSPRELEILEFINKEEGQEGLPETVHSCINSYFRMQYFNKQYMQKGGKKAVAPIIQEVTADQLCEQYGGKVKIIDSIEKCEFTLKGGSTVAVPLTMSDKFEGIGKKYTLA